MLSKCTCLLHYNLRRGYKEKSNRDTRCEGFMLPVPTGPCSSILLHLSTVFKNHRWSADQGLSDHWVDGKIGLSQLLRFGNRHFQFISLLVISDEEPDTPRVCSKPIDCIVSRDDRKSWAYLFANQKLKSHMDNSRHLRHLIRRKLSRCEPPAFLAASLLSSGYLLIPPHSRSHTDLVAVCLLIRNQ